MSDIKILSEEEIEGLSLSQMAEHYNAVGDEVGAKNIKKFGSRKAGITRILDIQLQYSDMIDDGLDDGLDEPSDDDLDDLDDDLDDDDDVVDYVPPGRKPEEVEEKEEKPKASPKPKATRKSSKWADDTELSEGSVDTSNLTGVNKFIVESVASGVETYIDLVNDMIENFTRPKSDAVVDTTFCRICINYCIAKGMIEAM